MPNTHRRRDATVELSRVCGVYWALEISTRFYQNILMSPLGAVALNYSGVFRNVKRQCTFQASYKIFKSIQTLLGVYIFHFQREGQAQGLP